MSEEEAERSSNKRVFDNIKGGGKKKSDKVVSLGGEFAYYKRVRYENWAFFAIFSFMHLDFVLFNNVKSPYSLFIFIIIQIITLVVLVLKKGWRESWELASNFFERIATADADNKKGNAIESGGVSVPFEKEVNQTDNSEEKLETLKTACRQDWFIFIILNFIFLDVSFFSALNNWAAPICLLILEGFIFFVLGKQMGMPYICKLISTILGNVHR